MGEVGGVRLPLQSIHGYGSLFMYSASTSPGGSAGSSGSGATGGSGSGSNSGEVTLRLREPEDIPEEVLARLEDTATLSISLQGDAVLRLGAATAGKFCSSLIILSVVLCVFSARSLEETIAEQEISGSSRKNPLQCVTSLDVRFILAGALLSHYYAVCLKYHSEYEHRIPHELLSGALVPSHLSYLRRAPELKCTREKEKKSACAASRV